jgi:hypothetical protein
VGHSYPNPIGFDGLLEAYCPPYFASMDAAVDAAIAGPASGKPEVPHSTSDRQPSAYLMADSEFREDMVAPSAAGIACTKAVCNYIFNTYGRFPATVDAMHLMCVMQAHHLDLDYYARFFHAGACGPTHMAHMQRWHTTPGDP